MEIATVQSDGLNLHAKPGGRVIDKLKHGERLHVLARVDHSVEWLFGCTMDRGLAHNVTGYFAARFVTVHAVPVQPHVEMPRPTAAPAPADERHDDDLGPFGGGRHEDAQPLPTWLIPVFGLAGATVLALLWWATSTP